MLQLKENIMEPLVNTCKKCEIFSNVDTNQFHSMSIYKLGCKCPSTPTTK